MPDFVVTKSNAELLSEATKNTISVDASRYHALGDAGEFEFFHMRSPFASCALLGNGPVPVSASVMSPKARNLISALLETLSSETCKNGAPEIGDRNTETPLVPLVPVNTSVHPAGSCEPNPSTKHAFRSARTEELLFQTSDGAPVIPEW
jgi:hypothetical protein